MAPRLEAILLVHGAGSGPWVFDGWATSFPELTVSAVDLQRGIVPASATMGLYAGSIVAEAGRMPFPLAIVGWSMGGLAAMMAAATLRPRALVLIEPSPPAEVQGRHDEIEPALGTYDPEATYGPFPPGIRARPESAPARAERRRGVSVPAIAGPCLVVSGDEFEHERGHAVARHYGCEELHLPGLRHWDLVLDERVPAAVASWLASLDGGSG
jgi:pimeloyl-ACP methyl ester carboxylesterase